MNDLDWASLNQIIETNNTNDFRIQSYRNNLLVLVGSFDLFYYHTVEIEFEGVSYISLPTEFYQPKFRWAKASEIQFMRQLIAIEVEEKVYCIEAETTSSIKKLPFYIVATTMNIKQEKVFYHHRANLQPGEKVANWIEILP